MRCGKTLITSFILVLFLSPLCVHAGQQETPDSKEMAALEGPQGEAVPSEKEAPPEEVTEAKTVADPLEPWNRLWFHFNDRLYYWVLKPAAKGYNRVIPEIVRISVRNFFNNITMPVRFVNCVLETKFKCAGNELARFGINSTAGVGGLFDVAKNNYHIEGQEKDTGQTLGYYGIGEGIYIVWPFLGPSSLRDTAGMVGDSFLTPTHYITPTIDAIEVEAYQYFNNVSLHLGDYEDLIESSFEPYTALKDAYIQHRRSLIKK
jgi:phospholipid-binding lipoprotein MlaA